MHKYFKEYKIINFTFLNKIVDPYHKDYLPDNEGLNIQTYLHISTITFSLSILFF